MKEQKKKRHIEGMDALRGFAILGVVYTAWRNGSRMDGTNRSFWTALLFSAWAFHKAGVTSVPYGSATATFIGSKKFQDISADQLQPGDIGLKSKTGGTGGANHVGIYCGKMKDGRVVWLHCTSSSSCEGCIDSRNI